MTRNPGDRLLDGEVLGERGRQAEAGIGRQVPHVEPVEPVEARAPRPGRRHCG